MYRSWQVLHPLLQRIGGDVIGSPFIVIFELVATICLFSVCRRQLDLVSLIMTIQLLTLSYIALKIILQSVSRITEHSTSYIVAGSRVSSMNLISRKQFRSYRPLRYKLLNSSVSISKVTFPNIMKDIILCNVINLMVMFPK